MPSFIDLFIPRFQLGIDEIRRALSGTFSPSSHVEILRNLIKPHWNFLTPVKKPSHVSGCDGSNTSFNLRNGGFLAIVRALTQGESNETRNLDVGVIQGTNSSQFLSHLMQLLEIRSMKTYLKESPPEVLIMDGSPITYLSQNLMDLQVYLPPDLNPLNFNSLSDIPPSAVSILILNEFIQLLESMNEQKIQLIGISKDSRVSQFQQVILKEQILIEIDQLPIDSLQKQELKLPLGEEIIDSYKVFTTFEKVAKIFGMDPYDDWQSLMNLVNLFLFPLSDPEVLNYCTDTAGFTKPLAIRANERLKRMQSLYFANTRKFITSNYSLSLSVVPPAKRCGFIQKVTRILDGMKEFPSVVSTFIKVTPRSYPLRVDILGEKGQFWEKPQYQFVTSSSGMEDALGIVQHLFVDDRIHNAILWEVDKEVRITRKQAQKVYLASLEQELGLSRSEFLARREIRHQ